MTKNKRQLGSEREKQAAEFLESLGYRILELNYYSRFGEIDIVAEDGIYLVFVEVKYRSGTGCGDPCEAIGLSKIKKICAASRAYLMLHHIDPGRPVRYDVVAILKEDIRLIPNAFEAV